MRAPLALALAMCAALAGGPAAHAQAATGAAQAAQPRMSRHALIIAVGEYLDPTIPTLRGVGYDIESATRMAVAMQVPEENIRVLRDAEATAANIEREIAALEKRTQPGDRVFFYFSGHGSRRYDASVAGNGCVEALLPSDATPLTNGHLASLLKPIADKSDKLFVFYDACHSGGIAGHPLAQARSMSVAGGTLTPKFSPAGAADQCARPANIKTRAFTVEAVRQGGQAENIVQISSSRPDEVSFDDDNGAASRPRPGVTACWATRATSITPARSRWPNWPPARSSASTPASPTAPNTMPSTSRWAATSSSFRAGSQALPMLRRAATPAPR
jgi:hypothetical protein